MKRPNLGLSSLKAITTVAFIAAIGGMSACSSEGDDPLGDRGGAATNLPLFDLRVVSPDLVDVVEEGEVFNWTVTLSNEGTGPFPPRTNTAVLVIDVTGNGSAEFVGIDPRCEAVQGRPNQRMCEFSNGLGVGEELAFNMVVTAGSIGTIQLSASVEPTADANPNNNASLQIVTVNALAPCPELNPCEVYVDHPRRRCETEPKPAGVACEAPGCLTGVCDGEGACGQLESKCEDNACTTSTCNAETNECEATNKPNGTVCGAANSCEGWGRCDSGECETDVAVVCDDGSKCTVDSCEVVNRKPECVNTPKVCAGYSNCGEGVCNPDTGTCEVQVDNSRCDDNIACTDDLCTSSGCTHIPRADRCSDSNLCDANLPVCDREQGCIEAECVPRIHGVDTCNNLPKSCDDGNSCTNDACAPATGACTNTPMACDDGNACTVDSCVAGACVYVPTNALCDDGNECNGAETCDAQRGCLIGTPLVCNDGDACNGVEVCDPTKGCEPGVAPACDDNNTCNGKETCDPAVGCVVGSPLACDDGNGCTTDSCDPVRGCVNTNNTAACDDGNACTTGDVCGGGNCGGAAPLACNDNNGCTTDTCDPVRGCVFTNNTSSCDDGNACTTGDVCGGGTCGGAAPLACNDNNGCTTDSCDPTRGCVFTNNTSSCDDGNACTTGDVCGGGTCGGAAPLACNDNNGCTTDSCDPTRGCVFTNNTSSCDDGNACTTGDVCGGGTCGGAAPVTCNDDNACTTDTCDPMRGCVFTNNTSSCDDGNACTTGDVCGGGTCGGAAPLACNDNNGCTTDTCDPTRGCVFTNNTSSCDDGNACTTGDVCGGGTCGGAAPLACNDNNGCTTDTCDPVRGCVFTNNTSSCDDGNACTTGDVCGGGTCGGEAPLACNDNNGCTTDTCDPTRGCVFTNNTSACDDGNACTTGDVCGGGTCGGSAPLACNDNNGCTTDTCDATRGCVFTNNTSSCDDGNACTTGDVCGGGTCGGAAPLACNDNNGCTTDTCDPTRGCVFTNNTSACNDGNACTTVDVCGGGTCGGAAPLACNDNNGCTTDTCDPVRGCVFTNNTLACNDGNACTTGEVCGGGTCGGSQPVVCNDGNACNGGETCDPATGCKAGTPLTCGDDNACTNDSCDPASGCVYVNNSNPCDDGNACNNACSEWDTVPSAAWTVTNYDAGAADHGLWLPGFDGTNGVTFMSLLPDTRFAWWDDGSATLSGTVEVTRSPGNIGLGDRYEVEMHFTYRGVGADGEGDGGPKMSEFVEYSDTLGWHYFDMTSGFVFGLDDANDVTTLTQYPANSMMPFQVGLGANDKTLAFGAAMWFTFDRSFDGGTTAGVGDINGDLDAYECPTGDVCDGGECVGRAAEVCEDDGNPCTFELCDPVSGCYSEPREGTCDDGNACTTGDVCGAANCGGTPVSCDDGDACTADSCDAATGCVNTPIPGCGLCEVCVGVESLTLKVSAWQSTRDQNETVRVRKNSMSGEVLFSGKVNNNASFSVNVPAGTTSLVVTVQGASHANETQKASFTTNCALAVGAENGNSYVKFKVTALVQRTQGYECDDGDECTVDVCTATGCTNTEIPGCGQCETCVGVEQLTLKVSAWAANRDQNETVRVRKNSASGEVLFSGTVANNGTFNVAVPNGTTSIVLTVQGASHANETQKATFTTDCALAQWAENGNSYVKFKVTSIVQRNLGANCDDGDECTTDLCTASGCTNTPIAGCGLCESCVGVERLTLKVSAWAANRSQSETIRVRKDSMSGAILFSGSVNNNATFSVNVPAGTTKVILTVQGTNHTNETQKASLTTNCNLAVNAQSGNSYIMFKATEIVQRTEGIDCDDGDECTVDTCTASGCSNEYIPGCGLCEVCTGVDELTLKVTAWAANRDQGETVRFRRNSSTGTELFRGTLANNASKTVTLPAATTKVYVSVRGNSHATETVKAIFDTNCSLVPGAVSGNSYIKLTATGVSHSTELAECIE